MLDCIKIGCVLMVYALIASVALAFVNIKTLPLIEENKTAAEKSACMKVLPDMAGDYEVKDAGSAFPYWIGYRDKDKSEIGGYIFITSGTGYSSIIESMVGVDVNGIITGVQVIFQQETPGLGARAEEINYGENEPWFTRQFKGKSLQDKVRVVHDGGVIDSITGATITSRAITDSIHEGMANLNQIVSDPA